MSAVLDVEDLRIVFDRRGAAPIQAVRGVSFSINAGETLCLVGESGSGKTLTGSAIMRLLPQSARMSVERLRLSGLDLMSMMPRELARARGEHIGMIFQNPTAALNPAFTIGDQLVETYRHHQSASRSAARDRAVFMLERAGIPAAAERLGQYPHQLSGGLAQRVMIALALICGPQLLIADEPTTALDVTTQAQILRLLSQLQNEFGMALLMITHDLRLASRIAHRVAVMYAGQFVETGSRADVFSRQQHPYTRALFGSAPMAGRKRLASIPGYSPRLVADEALCTFRQRCLQVRDACHHDTVPWAPDPDHSHAVRCLFPLGCS